MNLVGILIAVAVVAGTALIVGLLLGIAGVKFRIEVDEKELAVRGFLPGNNCGGCGYAGCDALAKAIALGEAATDACPVGGTEVAKQISELMGVKGTGKERQVAFVKCNGTCDKTSRKYNYYGIEDCRKAALVPGKGDKACNYGCMGFGTCVKVCPFDAIHIVNGVAAVEKEACKACGKCIAECPNHLIELIPYKAKVHVQCNSHDKGKDVKAACSVGCIGCTLCTKVCPTKAITVTDNLAYINQKLCTGCGACAEKCPVKAITVE